VVALRGKAVVDPGEWVVARVADVGDNNQEANLGRRRRKMNMEEGSF